MTAYGTRIGTVLAEVAGSTPITQSIFLLRGNCGIKSHLLLEVVGQKLPIALLSLGSLKILRRAVTLLLEPS
jgi:hypothetical protein